MKKVFEALFAGIVAGLAAKLYIICLAKGLNTSISLTISVVISVAFATILKYLTFDFPRRFKFFRISIHPESKFEGVWLLQIVPSSKVSGEYFYTFAVAHIFYNVNSEKYCYEGRAYDQNGILKGRWHSTQMAFIVNTNQFEYFYEGEVYRSSTERIPGVGILKFEKDEKGKFSHATDYFIEMNRSLGSYQCFSKKVSQKQLKQYRKYGQINYDLLVANYDNL